VTILKRGKTIKELDQDNTAKVVADWPFNVGEIPTFECAVCGCVYTASPGDVTSGVARLSYDSDTREPYEIHVRCPNAEGHHFRYDNSLGRHERSWWEYMKTGKKYY
jgi:rubredoxin